MDWKSGLQGTWFALLTGSTDGRPSISIDKYYGAPPSVIPKGPQFTLEVRNDFCDKLSKFNQPELGTYLVWQDKNFEITQVLYQPVSLQTKAQWQVTCVRWRSRIGKIVTTINRLNKSFEEKEVAPIIQSWNPNFPGSVEELKNAPPNPNGHPVFIPTWCEKDGYEFAWPTADDFWAAVMKINVEHKFKLIEETKELESEIDLA